MPHISIVDIPSYDQDDIDIADATN